MCGSESGGDRKTFFMIQVVDKRSLKAAVSQN